MLNRLREGLLVLLILFLPSQLGYHFWPSWSFVHGLPIDFLSPTFYFTDILLLSYVVVSLFINRQLKLSLKSTRVLIICVLVIALNVIFSQSPPLTFFKWLNLFKYISFVYFLYIQNTSAIPIIRKTLPLAVIWSSIIGWCQFITQSSLGGLAWWLGERALSITSPGISIVPSLSLDIFNFTLYTPQLLRTYSTFSHPNSLSGFLLLSLILMRLLNINNQKRQSGLIKLSYLITTLTIFITFSRTTIFMLIVLFVFQNYSRHKLISLIILISTLLLIPYLIKLGNPSAFSDRLSLVKSAITISIQHPIFGAGLGTNPLMLLLPQPVHNLPLLLTSELGYPFTLLVIFTVVFFLKPILLRRSSSTQTILLGCLTVFFTGLLDHYWLTLNQNMLLLSVFLSVSAIISSMPSLMNNSIYYQINCDGGSRGNPGPAASAFVIRDSTGLVVFQDSEFLGKTTNNQAEYQAVINALLWLEKNVQSQSIQVEFNLDSQLVVNQMIGVYQVKDPLIRIKYQQAQNLISRLTTCIIKFKYIPRAENYTADLLVNQSLDQHSN